jgi:hypothetical protein
VKILTSRAGPISTATAAEEEVVLFFIGIDLTVNRLILALGAYERLPCSAEKICGKWSGQHHVLQFGR